MAESITPTLFRSPISFSGNIYCFSLATTSAATPRPSPMRQMTLPPRLRSSSFPQITIAAAELDHHYLDADVKYSWVSDRPPAAPASAFPRLQLRVCLSQPPKAISRPFCSLSPSLSGILVNLHHSPAASSSGTSSSSSSSSGRRSFGRHCGSINTNVVQQVVAAKWATDVINNQSLPYELKIGE